MRLPRPGLARRDRWVQLRARQPALRLGRPERRHGRERDGSRQGVKQGKEEEETHGCLSDCWRPTRHPLYDLFHVRRYPALPLAQELHLLPTQVAPSEIPDSSANP